jgi:hypothetical protein
MVDSPKLRLNRVLNTGGARGAALGNTFGCLGLYYAGIESLAGGAWQILPAASFYAFESLVS